MSERQGARLWLHPNAVIIRTPMTKAIAHAGGNRPGIRLPAPPRSLEKAYDATHCGLTTADAG